MELKDIVKDGNQAYFTHACAGVLYYKVTVDGSDYRFVVDMNDKEDVGTADFPSQIKAITLMRYIRKSMAAGEFIKLN